MRNSTIYHLNKSCIAFIACFVCFTNSLQAQIISNVSVSETSVCSGSAIHLTFDITNGTEESQYFTTSTTFQAYLSNNSGTDYEAIGLPFQLSDVGTSAEEIFSIPMQTFTIPANTIAGNQYKIAIISSGPDFDGRSVVSGESSAFIVNEPVNITIQPANTPQIVCPGGIASLSIAASGNELAYQWYRNTIPSNSEGEIISGANFPTYLPETLNPGTFYYYAIIKKVLN